LTSPAPAQLPAVAVSTGHIVSQIEAWSSSIYAWYQKFEFDFMFEFFFEFQTEVAKI
jgi:hypothetical protein